MLANIAHTILENDVRLLLNPATSSAFSNPAVERLSAEIQMLARAVVRRGTRGQRDDFVESAPAYLLVRGATRIVQFDPLRGSFRTWAKMCLRNAWVSQLRRRGPDHDFALQPYCVPSVADENLVSSTLGNLDTLFIQEDVNEMATWPMSARLVLLVCGGLWRKVPQDCLTEWLNGAAEEMNFSPETLLGAVATWDPYEPSSLRNEPLARALGWKANRVVVIWNREQNRLRRLLFVRDLQQRASTATCFRGGSVRRSLLRPSGFSGKPPCRMSWRRDKARRSPRNSHRQL